MDIKIITVFLLFLFSFIPLHAQDPDSLMLGGELEPVEVTVYFNKQPMIDLTASAEVVGVQEIESQQTHTLLPALNRIAGVRMEERSPGSYRMALRSSLIRSPFGIRNVKIYVDEFPLTDAGGNTYLNLLDPGAIASISVLKGPDGSLYGANSGGVVNIVPKGFEGAQHGGRALLSGGSYGLFQEQLSVQRRVGDRYSFSVDQSFTRSDGYRENTALNKKTLQTTHKWQYGEDSEVRLLALYSDLDYRTPGGLTESEMKENRRSARPAMGASPSAVEQRAGIRNRTLFGGVAHEVGVAKGVRHSVSLFGSYVDFENPFITNYEFRKEKNLGVRTYFSYKERLNSRLQWEMQLGLEGQKGWYAIDNYDNEHGVATDEQAMDDLSNWQGSLFYRAMVRIDGRWIVEGSVGLNGAKVGYRQRYPKLAEGDDSGDGDISFGAIWMPRVATSYRVSEGLALRASVSKGYSPPTIAEVRSSDNVINTSLEAETGVNYEVGMRWESGNRRFMADVGAYRYRMRNGIVRHLRESGAEYYANAGEIKQRGVEASMRGHLVPMRRSGVVRGVRWFSSLAYNHYRFGNYRVGEDDFSGNRVTAVPDWVWTNEVVVRLGKAWGVNVLHNFTSSMPLNDANAVFADKFHLVQLKGTWDVRINPLAEMQLFVGVDNLLNERYSLGNDINAFGNRFFNPAAERNWYGGIRVRY